MRYEIKTQSGSVYEIDTERKTYKRTQADQKENTFMLGYDDQTEWEGEYAEPDGPFCPIMGERMFITLKPHRFRDPVYIHSTPVVEIHELA